MSSVLDQFHPNRDNPSTVVEGVVVEPFIGQNHLGMINTSYSVSVTRVSQKHPLSLSGVQSTTFTRSCQMLFPFLMSTYSRLSARACQLASMMLGELPTVLQTCWPSLESISTRVCAAVPASPSRMRTL